MHQLKYKGRKDAGIWLGKQMGISLNKCNRFNEIDIVVPVPLHPAKEFKRGYNQSLMICQGVEKTTGWVVSDVIARTVNTDSQTRKSKFERWQNVDGRFTIKPGADIRNLNALLVDDIVTTGATLEANARALLAGGAKSVSIATIAVA